MDINEYQKLHSALQDLWAEYSDAADYRKSIDRIYGQMLNTRKILEKCLLKEKNEKNIKLIYELIDNIDSFYHIDRFPDWKSYENEARRIDSINQSVQKIISNIDNDI